MGKSHLSKLLAFTFLITSFYSCERINEFYRLSDTSGTKVVQESCETGEEKPEVPCGEPVIIPLVFKSEVESSPGNVVVTNDEEYLYVKFEITEGDWKIDQIYLYVGAFDQIPLEGGHYPAFWDFKYRYSDKPVGSYTFSISLADLDDCFKILAQAHVVDSKENKAELWTKGENPKWTQGPFYTYYCVENCGGCKTCIYRTQTPGGWGAKAAGNNPGAYRDLNFDKAFPDGLVVGIDDEDDDNEYYSIILTSSGAIEKLLPSGGKPAALKKSYPDPSDPSDPSEIKNVLVGHVVALSLTIGFDLYDPDFGKADGQLKDLIIADGKAFDGMSVAAILDEANIVLGGGNSMYTPSQMTDILTRINEYFVDGKQSQKYKLFDCKQAE